MARTVVITGASSGIGRELALLLSGDHLILNARRRDLLVELAQACDATAIPGTVADASVRGQILEAANQREGELVLVNNAGTSSFGDFEKMEWAAVEEQVEVNFTAALALTHLLVPIMLERWAGQVVNVLSIAARHAFPSAAVYGATKAGMLQFTRSLAAQVRSQGVRVAAILPGSTDTDLWVGKSYIPAAKDMLSAKAVAEAIRDVINAPKDRSIDEVVIMPPKGIL